MMRKMVGILLLLGWLVASLNRAEAQSLPLGVAYYDLGGLYDTVPAPFYYDPYTPDGERRWTTDRYEAALDRFAALIDSLGMPLVGIFGVENEAVALDLASRSREDYALLHQTQNRRDGLDFVLLYHGDRFEPQSWDSGLNWMRVEGLFDGEPIALILCRYSRYVEEEIERIFSSSNTPLIVMGGASLSDRFELRDGLERAHRARRGNRFVQGRWSRGDSFYISSDFRVERGDIYLREWMLDKETFGPLPLYDRTRYRGGYSAKLPVFIYLSKGELEN